MENLDFTLDEALKEIISRMETQGSFQRDTWESLIDEVLEEKQSEGLLPDDFDSKQAHEKLEYMLSEYVKEGGLE
ncbi:MAG: hypothetical protein PHI73_03790 [Patescibacteria group bacterium]|nr:hypothetical protein [Patescibacteria group bacterium]